MGFWGSIWNGVKSAVSGTVKAFGTAITSIGAKVIGIAAKVCTTLLDGAVAACKLLAAVPGDIGIFADAAGKFITAVKAFAVGVFGPVLGPIVAVVIVVAAAVAICKLAKKEDIIDENDTPEEVAVREEEAAKHAEWRSRDSFDSYKEYQAYLREKVDENIVKEKLAAVERRLAYKATGTGILLREIGAKYSLNISLSEFALIAGCCRLDTKELQAIIHAYNKLAMSELNLASYLQGKLSLTEAANLDDAIIAELKKQFPDKKEKELWVRLNGMKDASRGGDEAKLYISEQHKDTVPAILKKQELRGIDKELDIEADKLDAEQEAKCMEQIIRDTEEVIDIHGFEY